MPTLPAPRLLAGLPKGFRVEADARGLLAVRAELADELRARGLDTERELASAPSALAGRRPLAELALSGGERLVVRRHHHGGLLRALSGARFASPARPFRELRLADALARAGIATPEVVAARARRAPPFVPGSGWRLELVTRRVEGARELSELLERARAGELARGARRALLAAVGECVGRLHRAGFLHADLHPRNLLVQGEPAAGAPPRIVVLDLDRSRFESPLGERSRLANLARLHRAVRRRDAPGRALARVDWLRALRAYEAALGRPSAAWRADWRAVARAHARSLAWHRAGWLLERLYPPAPAAGGE